MAGAGGHAGHLAPGWSAEIGSLEAACARIKDLLTSRADRDRYYYGMGDLFDRHTDIVKKLTVNGLR